MQVESLRWMKVCSLRLVLSAILWSGLGVVRGLGQSSSYQTDTAYVSTLLKRGEAVEMQQPKVALNVYRQAHAMAEQIQFTKGYFESLRLLTYQLNNAGRHEEARQLAQKGLRLAQQDTSKRNLGICHYALANAALYSGHPAEAIPHYQRAAQCMEQLGRQDNVATVNQNIGLIYEGQKMYPQALNYYRRALTYHNGNEGDPRSAAIDNLSIGNVYVKQGNDKVGLRYYQRAKQLINPQKDLDFMVNLASNIGHIYENQARYDSALHYEREALRLSRELKNPRHELDILTMIAQTYNQSKQYRQAISLLDEAHQLAIRSRAGLRERRNIYRNYALANQNLGNYETAYEWRDKYEIADDSLNNQATKQLLQDYEVKLKQAEAGQKLARKQRQITQLEQESKRQNLWLLVAALIVVGVGGVLVFSYLYYRQRQQTAASTLLAVNRERELAVVQSELQGQQKERLRISKEMHDDLGASLTAIGLLSEVMKTRVGAADMPEVEKISSISAEMVTSMNEIIWSLNTRNDSLNGLIAYTRAYASEFIENTSLHLRTQVEESNQEITVRGTDRRNIFLTVKEALNNVVKHAQATAVTLTIQPRADQLVITVDDDGRGFVPSATTRLRNGLSNMANRMAESGGTCQVLPSSVGTSVIISYPYPLVSTGKNTSNAV